MITDLEMLFGGATRADTLAALAGASRPLTAYRVARLTDGQRTKVNAELRRLLAIGAVRRTSSGRAAVWSIADPDLQRLVALNRRLSWSDDLLDGRRKGSRRAEELRRRLEAIPRIDLSTAQRPSPRLGKETRRSPEKDRALARLGLPISRRQPRP